MSGYLLFLVCFACSFFIGFHWGRYYERSRQHRMEATVHRMKAKYFAARAERHNN